MGRMVEQWTTEVVVAPGGRVELVVPDLRDGERVVVSVRRRDANGAPSSVADTTATNGAAAEPSTLKHPKPKAGYLRDVITLHPGFNDELDDFQEYR